MQQLDIRTVPSCDTDTPEKLRSRFWIVGRRSEQPDLGHSYECALLFQILRRKLLAYRAFARLF
jgi:hypothetical protein